MTADRGGSSPGAPVAIIDCGTNTIRLLIASSDRRGGLTEHERRAEIVRLGRGVDATGEFHPDALQRTFEAAERYAALIRDIGVPGDNIRFLATSASRDATNRDEFFAGIRQRVGVTPEVITGDLEAEYSFAGALAGITDLRTPALVMDIGGGSTELILGDGPESMTAAASLDIGSVRLTERCWTADPPDPADLTRARDYVDDMLDQQDPGWRWAQTWIGVAGTLTTLAAVHQNLATYDRSRVHGHTISIRDLDVLFDRLTQMPVAAIRQLPTMPAQRADVITAGTLIATRVARRQGADRLTVSESDILDGAALDLFRTRHDFPDRNAADVWR